MRKLLLALSLGGLSCGLALLLLATFEIAPTRTLPIGLFAAIVGLVALLGVILLGQRTVMMRTSELMKAGGTRVGTAANASVDTDQIRRIIEETVRESDEALAWSLDARIVGLAEHFGSQLPIEGRAGGDDG